MRSAFGKAGEWSLKKFTSPFVDGDMVTGVMLDRGVEKFAPTPHHEITCPHCSGSVGYRVHDKMALWWCCVEDGCNDLIAASAARRKEYALRVAGSIPSKID